MGARALFAFEAFVDQKRDERVRILQETVLEQIWVLREHFLEHRLACQLSGDQQFVWNENKRFLWVNIVFGHRAADTVEVGRELHFGKQDTVLVQPGQVCLHLGLLSGFG